MGTFPKSFVGLQCFTLIEVQPIGMNVIPPRLGLSQVGCPRLGWIDYPVEVHKLNSTCSLVELDQFFLDGA